MRTLALGLLAAAVLCPCATAQQAGAGLAKEVEQGSLGSLGARIAVFFAKTDHVASGVEVGYSRLAGLETEFRMGPSDQSVLQWERAQRKLWHATFNVRRQWLDVGPQSALYAGGGTGVYYLSTKSEFWEGANTGFGNDPKFRESNNNSLHFGMNVGGGLSLRPTRGPGSIDFGIRLHMLPFAGSEGVRSVLTFSAGLSLF